MGVSDSILGGLSGVVTNDASAMVGDLAGGNAALQTILAELKASVICKRQGLACYNLIKLHLDDNMVLAARVAQEVNDWKPDKVFIDQGAGVGVIDRLRQLGFDVVEVPFGSTADDSKHYANKRAEMWSDRKSTRLNSSHSAKSRMPSSA